MNYPRNASTDNFKIFDKLAEDCTDKKILDYGGNRGNLLYFSQGKIKEENYTCIDVDKEAIESGKNEFLNANFIHYNRFSPMYNEGNIDEPFPILEEKFDICFAYSVFTHTDFLTFETTIKYLQGICKKLIISFVSNENVGVKTWVSNKRQADFGSCLNLDVNANYFYLINNDKIYIEQKVYNKKESFFFSFYKDLFIKTTFECDTFLNPAGQDFLIL